MGLRFRKSINLGGGFRVNISGSGIGYSWGVKGYRHTKTADGRTRNTVSIPGTGVSWVEESRQNGTNLASNNPKNNHTHATHTETIENASAENMVSAGLEELLGRVRTAIRLDHFANVLLICFAIFALLKRPLIVLLAAAAAFKIFIRRKGKVNLDYEIEEEQFAQVQQRIEPFLQMADSQCVWRIVQQTGVNNPKYAAGASTQMKRTKATASRKLPFPLSSNGISAAVSTKKETLVFLPDKLLIMQGRKIGALDYKDVHARAGYSTFIESDRVPGDAKIIDWTWKYVNKNGSPDQRFSNNPRLPVCKYGKITLNSAAGLNTIIMFSHAELTQTGPISGYGDAVNQSSSCEVNPTSGATVPPPQEEAVNIGFCIYCGQKLSAGAKFCHACGQSVDQMEQTVQNQSAGKPSSASREAHRL